MSYHCATSYITRLSALMYVMTLWSYQQKLSLQ